MIVHLCVPICNLLFLAITLLNLMRLRRKCMSMSTDNLPYSQMAVGRYGVQIHMLPQEFAPSHSVKYDAL